MQTKTHSKFDVGGVMLDQPFKIRRLGHFGLNVDDPQACVNFYTELLGFRISDTIDLGARMPDGGKSFGDPKAYFMRHGTDHHSFVLFNRGVMSHFAANSKNALPADVTVNQMTWQVGSLKEIAGGVDWFRANDVDIHRIGRDMPGSNWHVYPYDTEMHRNELYYGMEQIGWQGFSKPQEAHERGFEAQPTLPQMPEYQEVNALIARGADLNSGVRHPETQPASYDVDGILLPRPFKVVRHGPVRLFCHDPEKAERFYTEVMGLVRTETITWRGHRAVFLRCNTEHHVLALYPIAIRDELGWPKTTTLAGFGMQVGSYRQLRDAIAYLRDRGARFVTFPSELTPGIDYAAYLLDPAGHPIQLYYSMEQIGWDGRVRPHEGKSMPPIADWPETVAARSDSYMGETYLGPWG